MKKRFLSVLLVSLLILSVYSPAGAAAHTRGNVAISTTTNVSQTVVSLDKASKANIVELFEGSAVAELRTVSTISGKTYTTGYVMAGTTKLDEAIDNFEERYYNLLVETKEAYKDNNPEMYAVFSARLETYLEKGMSISAVVVNGELDEEFAHKVDDEKFVKQIDELYVSPVSANASVAEIASTTASTSSNWIPTSGSAVVWNSNVYDDAVYMNLNWTWDSAADMTLYRSTNNITLESEICFRNFDGNGHAVQWYSGDWTYDTNQPSPYIDTQFNFGDLSEVPFTIGCYDAHEFEHGENYYWVCYGDINNAAGSDAKIYFQRGHKVLGIPNTWTVAADEAQIVLGYNSWNTGTQASVSFTWPAGN